MYLSRGVLVAVLAFGALAKPQAPVWSSERKSEFQTQVDQSTAVSTTPRPTVIGHGHPSDFESCWENANPESWEQSPLVEVDVDASL